MFNTQAFGMKLAQLRKNADMTQSELAEHLNVTRQAVSKYEIGDSFPDVSILVLIAEVFDISVDQLICAGKPTAGEAAILNGLARGEQPSDEASVEDVMTLAPWLRPSVVEKLTANLAKDGINLRYLTEFAAYLSDEGTRHLLEQSDCASMTPEMLERLLPSPSGWFFTCGHSPLFFAMRKRICTNCQLRGGYSPSLPPGGRWHAKRDGGSLRGLTNARILYQVQNLHLRSLLHRLRRSPLPEGAF